MNEAPCQSSIWVDGQTTTEELETIMFQALHQPVEDREVFFAPPDPHKLPSEAFGVSAQSVTRAAALITKAVMAKAKILIYGDYDVDGICATALLWEAIKKLGAKVYPFIPHRERDGYGITVASLKRLLAKLPDIQLVITVDNGIVAHEALEYAKQHGLTIIIVDHHVKSLTLPPHNGLIYSTQTAGATLAWLLARSLQTNSSLELATLGTVADCIPLLGPNRALVFHGLTTLTTTTRPGIQALLAHSGQKAKQLSASDLSYILSPRLNASGRLGSANDSLKLLLSPSLATADTYAKLLEEHNAQRQSMQKAALAKAEKLYEQEATKAPILIVSDPSFHPGIIGLIAGKMTEKYAIPSIVISIGPTEAKASCRSIPSVDILTFLKSAPFRAYLSLGGHAQAAGFSIASQDIGKLTTQLSKYALKTFPAMVAKTTPYLACAKASFVSLTNCQLIRRFEPFGMGNNEPQFYFPKLRVVQTRIVGQGGEHLQLLLDDPDTAKLERLPAQAIAFKQAKTSPSIVVGSIIGVFAYLSLNTFNGRETAQLRITRIISN